MIFFCCSDCALACILLNLKNCCHKENKPEKRNVWIYLNKRSQTLHNFKDISVMISNEIIIQLSF